MERVLKTGGIHRDDKCEIYFNFFSPLRGHIQQYGTFAAAAVTAQKTVPPAPPGG